MVSPGIVCYAGKQEKPFWFSSLGQMVQFGAIIFRRTFKNYFGQFVWIEKKKSHFNNRVSLHEAPTNNSRVSRHETPTNMSPADQLDIFRPKLFLKDIKREANAL